MSPPLAACIFLAFMLVLAIYCWFVLLRGLFSGVISATGNSPNTYQKRRYRRKTHPVIFTLVVIGFLIGALASSGVTHPGVGGPSDDKKVNRRVRITWHARANRDLVVPGHGRDAGRRAWGRARIWPTSNAHLIPRARPARLVV